MKGDNLAAINAARWCFPQRLRGKLYYSTYQNPRLQRIMKNHNIYKNE